MSADGGQVVFADGPNLYLRARDGTPAVQLGSGFQIGSLSPDGSHVATVRLSDNQPVLLPTREGETVELPQDATERASKRYSAIRWMPDGRRLLISVVDGTGSRIFIQDRAGELARPVSPPGFSDPLPSPDGRRFIAIDTAGRLVMFGLDGVSLASVAVSHRELRYQLLRWTSDGRAVYAYRIGDWPGQILRVDLQTGAETVARKLVPPDLAGVWRIHPVVVTADGSHYAYGVTQNLQDLYIYDGLR
jgi:hypothetical protein